MDYNLWEPGFQKALVFDDKDYIRLCLIQSGKTYRELLKQKKHIELYDSLRRGDRIIRRAYRTEGLSPASYFLLGQIQGTINTYIDVLHDILVVQGAKNDAMQVPTDSDVSSIANRKVQSHG